MIMSLTKKGDVKDRPLPVQSPIKEGRYKNQQDS